VKFVNKDIFSPALPLGAVRWWKKGK